MNEREYAELQYNQMRAASPEKMAEIQRRYCEESRGVSQEEALRRQYPGMLDIRSQFVGRDEHLCHLGHGYTVVWTDSDGGQSRIHACGFQTHEEMLQERAEAVKRWGWTPPRWWQWWRWNDTRIPDNETG